MTKLILSYCKLLLNCLFPSCRIKIAFKLRNYHWQFQDTTTQMSGISLIWITNSFHMSWKYWVRGLWHTYLLGRDAFIATYFVLNPRILAPRVPGLRSYFLWRNCIGNKVPHIFCVINTIATYHCFLFIKIFRFWFLIYWRVKFCSYIFLNNKFLIFVMAKSTYSHSLIN